MKSLFYLSLAAVFFLASCSQGPAPLEERENKQYDLALSNHLEIYGTLPTLAENPANPSTDEKVELGQLLYFDKRLSKDNTVSCNSCHNLKTFGVDNLPTSPGVGGTLGGRNSPTVLNAALHKTQFWDGRAKDVEEQAGMPITNPIEMAIPDKQYLVEKLSQIPLYQEKFKAAYPNVENPITYDNLQNAIGAFERELITPSPFDDYLAGDEDALTVQQKKGMMSFSLVGCTTCHSGELLGGNLFQKFGVHHDYWKYTKGKKIDEGRYEVTQNEAEKYIFKVPSLRNVAMTGPYFHDGAVADLSEAVWIMAKVQLDVDLSEEEVANITAFLEALTGEVPEELAEEPAVLKQANNSMASL